MRKVIIIHGWESNPSEHWYLEEKRILEGRGYEVLVPEMPDSAHPQKDEWVKTIGNLCPDENTILVGHSLGTPAILRYLEQSGQKVDKVISIAGFAQDLGYAETSNFVEEPFDWDKIKILANKFVIIAQKEDPYVSVEIAKEVADKTNGEWVLVDGDNHFDKMDLDLMNGRLNK